MKSAPLFLCVGLFFSLTAQTAETSSPKASPSRRPGYTGSSQCRSCHEHFYKLWAPSHHGLAMQPFTPEFARTRIVTQKEDIKIGKYRYRAEIDKDGTGWVRETGPGGVKRYRILHAMGGKNLYYFLTLLERGRLQVLPVAFDVRKREWYDTTASMVRHAADFPDRPIFWKEWPLTFNTSCYSCHVSQLSTNYDPKTDTYHTAWVEPGINCETCHGPASEHVKVCLEARKKGEEPHDLKIIRTSVFTPRQTNELCAVCHAKEQVIATGFTPGDRFFDHFGLVTLEDRDFYPDGRDLGLSPCARAGKLDCMHCHTSSGRYRFKEKNTNGACMPCHKEYVANPEPHTHHKPKSKGSVCVECHMPMTTFARMRRSDHSMLPPTPRATIEFKSPNACNICHTEKDAVWADKWVGKWYRKDYQKPALRRARLIDAARKNDWSKLPEILAYIKSPSAGEIYKASFLRLLGSCEDEKIWPVIRSAAGDSSPLVRTAAVDMLSLRPDPENRNVLLKAVRDDYRVVRMRAAAALSQYPRPPVESLNDEHVKKATREYLDSLTARPDDSYSHYNLGNYLFARGELEKALAAYEKAIALRSDNIMALVNAALLSARLGRSDKAETLLERALSVDPENAVANFNFALLTAERGELAEAEKHLRKALKSDPRFAAAAYNLGVLLARRGSEEALEWCRKAAEWAPAQPRYAYTFAYYLAEAGYNEEAESALRRLIERHPSYAEAYTFLGHLLEKRGAFDEAVDLYRTALNRTDIPAPERARFSALLRRAEANAGR